MVLLTTWLREIKKTKDTVFRFSRDKNEIKLHFDSSYLIKSYVGENRLGYFVTNLKHDLTLHTALMYDVGKEEKSGETTPPGILTSIFQCLPNKPELGESGLLKKEQGESNLKFLRRYYTKMFSEITPKGGHFWSSIFNFRMLTAEEYRIEIEEIKSLREKFTTTKDDSLISCLPCIIIYIIYGRDYSTNKWFFTMKRVNLFDLRGATLLIPTIWKDDILQFLQGCYEESSGVLKSSVDTLNTITEAILRPTNSSIKTRHGSHTSITNSKTYPKKLEQKLRNTGVILKGWVENGGLSNKYEKYFTRITFTNDERNKILHDVDLSSDFYVYRDGSFFLTPFLHINLTQISFYELVIKGSFWQDYILNDTPNVFLPFNFSTWGTNQNDQYHIFKKFYSLLPRGRPFENNNNTREMKTMILFYL